MDDIINLNKEVIIKDEHSSEDDHYDVNDPPDMLLAKNLHQLDKSQDTSNQLENNSPTNDTQPAKQDFDSDEDLAGIQIKLRMEQQNPKPMFSQQMIKDFGNVGDLAEMQNRRPTVTKQPTITTNSYNQPTLSKECAICQKHFNYRQDFINHARKYHPNGKAFRCTVCSLVFVNIQSVSRHSKNHKDRDRVKKHVCEYCSKSFLHRDTYKRHIEIHDKGKIYVCSICNNSYKSQYSLKKHQKTHLEMDGNNDKTDLNFAGTNEQISFEENVEDNISLINIASLKQEENNTIPLDLQFDLALNSEYIEEEQLLEVKKEGEIFKIEYVDEQHEAEQFEKNCNINDTQHLHMSDAGITNEGDREAKRFRTMSTVDTKCAVCLQEFTIRQDLIDHAQQYHPNAKAFKCIICSMRFSNILSISRHRRVHKNLPKIPCPYCSKSFMNKDDHRRHITKVHAIEIAKKITLPAVDRKCAVCDEEFPSRQDLIKHAAEFHPNGKAFKCTLCSMVFKNAHYISRHRRNHKNMPRKFHCDSCFKTFRDLDTFKRHLKVHNVQTSYHCSLCNKFFQYKESLKHHQLTHTTEESIEGDLEKVVIKDELVNKSMEGDLAMKPIEGVGEQINEVVENSQIPVIQIQRAVETKCAVCKKEFRFRQDLIKHAHLEHPNDRVFKCSICPRVFKNIHYLSTHRRVHKNLPRKHVCKICFKSFRDTDNFHRHLKVHTRKPIYQCTICFKSYKHKTSLKNHLKIHLEKPKVKEQKVKKLRKPIAANFKRPVEMQCAVCQQKFDYRFELVNHVQLNHPNAKAYKCGLCPKVFVNIAAISHHRNIHKVFACKLCSKSFTCRDDLKLHIRIHTKERPYCCFICKTTYKRRDSWLKHKTCHCKPNKANETNIGLKTQFEAELNKNLDKFTDITRQINFNADGQNELEMNSERKEDEHILQVNNDKEILENFNLEDDQLEDIFNTNETKQNSRRTSEKENDDFLLEVLTNQKIIRPKRSSVENKNYEMLEDNSDTNDSEQKRKAYENDDDYKNVDDEEDGDEDDGDEDDHEDDDEEEEEDEEEDEGDDNNIDNDDDLPLQKKSNHKKIRTELLKTEDNIFAVLDDNSNTNDSQQIILTDEEDGNENYDHDNGNEYESLVYNVSIINDSNMSAVDTKCAVCNEECDSRKMLTKHADKFHPNENAFKCTDCLLLFKSINAIASHVRSHSRRIIDKKCGVCHMEFAARHELVKHAAQFHPNQRAIKCALCPRVFKSTTCISSHRRTHKNMPKKYVCNACNTSYSDIANYKAHLRSLKHKYFSENRKKIKSEEELAEFQDRKFRKYICPYCSLSMMHKDDFKRHVKTHSDMGYRPQLIVDKKCAACQKEFLCRQDLLDHAKEFHPNGKAFKCALCPMLFQHITSVTGHRRRVHKLEQRKHYCKVCKKFITQDSVRSHLKSKRHHFFVNEYQRISSEKLSNKGINHNLSTYSITTNSNEKIKETPLEIYQETQSKQESSENFNKSIISNETDKDTASLSNCDIEEEIDIHSESKDASTDVLEINETELIDDNVVINAADKDNTISIDNDTSQNIESFNDGYISETISNIKDCNICGESFLSVSHLKRHLSKHSPERPYPCSFCDKRYKRKDDMRTHQRKFHFDLLLSLAEKTLEAEKKHYKQTINLETHQKNDDNVKDINDKEDTKSDLRSVIKKDLIERPFKCTFCYRRYSRKQHMQIHQQKIHPDRLNSLTQKTIDKEKNLEICNNIASTKPASSLKYPENILINEDSMQPQNLVENTDDMQSHKNTPNIEEEPFSVNILEITKTEYVYNEINSFEISHDIQSIENSTNPQDGIPNDALNKTTDFNESKEDNLYQVDGKDLSDEYHKPILNDNEDLLETLTNLPSTSQSISNKSRKTGVKGLLAIDRKCAVCKKEFICRKDFLKHVEHFHPNCKAFKCNLCPMVFSNVCSIPRHRRKFHTESGIEKVCPYCSEIFNRGDSFQKHLQEHRENLNNLTQQDLSINEESNEDTMSFNSHDNNSIVEVESENNSEDDVEQIELKNSLKIKEKHYTDDNDSQDDSDIDERETGTNYSYQNASHEEDEYVNSIIKYRERKPPMLDNKCVICFQIFEFQRDLITHAQKCHPSVKALKCRNCDVTFSNSGSISRHFRIHKTLTKKYVCEYCYKRFPYKDYLKTHIKKTHFTVGSTHSCDLCEKTYKHMDALIAHRKTHLSKESNEDDDDILNTSKNVENEEFITGTSITESDQIKEANLENSSVVSEAEDDDQILRSVTETLNKFKSRHRLLEGKCAFCKTVINNYQEFVKHLAKFHPEFEAFKCKKCDNHFPNTRSLTYHNYYCHSEKREKHICDICSQSFDRVSKLKEHLITHEEDPFKCKKCDNRFSNRKSLSSHMYYSHSENRKKHICGICSKSFNRVSNLKSHLNIHTDERPFSCNICNKNFKDNRNLKIHQKVHLKTNTKYPDEDVKQHLQQHDESQQLMNITDAKDEETINLENNQYIKQELNLNESLYDNS